MNGRRTIQRFEADLRILDLDDTASEADIRQSYRDLVMVWHPDRFAHNPRLRQKAEAKLKLFNQAYAHLKERQPRLHMEASDYASESAVKNSGTNKRRAQTRHAETRARSAGSDRDSSSRTTAASESNPARRKDLDISLEEAQFILKHFSFQLLHQAEASQHQGESPHRQYQGGPFMLLVHDSPPEVMLSVPCNSLHAFDRILLTIPCKSTGYFVQQEAEQLLECLRTQQ